VGALKFDPLDYDIYHLGISGGKDSTAVLLWLVYESGWPLSRLRVTFCDTDNEDILTYNYLAMLTERVFPIRVMDPGIGFYELVVQKKRFPARKARFCTRILKILPSLKHIEELKQQGRVLVMSGIRKAEGHNANDRGLTGDFYHDDNYGCDKFLPIYEWSMNEIWNIHQKHLDFEDVRMLIEIDPNFSEENRAELIGRMERHYVPRNPIYDMGASRVGCFPCISSNKGDIRSMARFRPERIDFIESKEGSHFTTSPDMYATMFSRQTVPERWRSKAIITKYGEHMNVPTIRDVVEWSKTAWGARQFSFDFQEDDLLSCDMRGMCE
jgi:3'-phosphoadenosine 5'-phosphosulfate sulfotransferase (PAPS reductase)/FAD synthetase